MTEDPYRLDDDLQLSSIDSDFEDEYDGLETELASERKSGIRKMPLVLGLMGIVFVSGAAYIAYQMFVADIGPITPAQPPMAMAPQARQEIASQDQPPFAADDVMPQDMPPAMEGETALQDMPPADDMMPPMADADMPPMPNDMGVADPVDPAVTAEGLLPPQDAVEVTPAVTAEATNTDAMADMPAAPETVTEQGVSGDVAPVVTATETTTETVATSATDAVSTDTSTPVAAAPSEELLQPIDPVPAAPAPVADEAAPAKAATTPAAKTTSKTTKKVDEVQKILESAGIDKAPSQPAAPPPPVEVTPRAREVIVVTRSYGAQSPQAALAAGDRVLQAHQYDAAAEIYDNQLRQNPSDPLALAGKALALQKAGNDVEAMNTYERLISLNPRDVEAMTNYLGLLQNQDPQQALTRLQNLASQYPQNAAVAGQLGMLYARMMDTPNAIRSFQSAAALDATSATYPFNLAVLYDRLGSKEKAKIEYRRALGLARDYPSRAEVSLDVIRQRLSALRN